MSDNVRKVIITSIIALSGIWIIWFVVKGGYKLTTHFRDFGLSVLR